jgi:hypothetical protein
LAIPPLDGHPPRYREYTDADQEHYCSIHWAAKEGPGDQWA